MPYSTPSGYATVLYITKYAISGECGEKGICLRNTIIKVFQCPVMKVAVLLLNQRVLVRFLYLYFALVFTYKARDHRGQSVYKTKISFNFRGKKNKSIHL